MPKPTVDLSKFPDLSMHEVVSVRVIGPFRIHVVFANGMNGERDMRYLTEKSGEMALPLRDPVFFSKVFIELGALTWPNGYDLDPIFLYDQMSKDGALSKRVAA